MCTLHGGCKRHGLKALLMTIPRTDEERDYRAALLHPCSQVLLISFLLTYFVINLILFVFFLLFLTLFSFFGTCALISFVYVDAWADFPVPSMSGSKCKLVQTKQEGQGFYWNSMVSLENNGATFQQSQHIAQSWQGWLMSLMASHVYSRINHNESN